MGIVKAFALACLLSVLCSPFTHACSYNVVQKVTNSWQEKGVTMVQYDISVTNTGETLHAINFVAYAPVSQYWTAEPQADGSLGFPSWLSASGFANGKVWAWGLVTAGAAALSSNSNPADCTVNYQQEDNAASGGGSSGGSGGSSSGGNPTPSSYCAGNPPTYNGLPCASTTRYYDGTTGACGCGDGDNGPFPWQRNAYTAAGSQAIFGDGTTWCGGGCGACYELTPTGDCPTGGPCATQTGPIVVMVTNLCPNAGNQEWCPNVGQINQHGYGGHFDLQDSAKIIASLGWNNPVVTYRQVACGTRGSPSCSDAKKCQCGTSQCGAGGIATYSDIKNMTYVDEPDPKKAAANPKDTKKGLPTYAIALVAFGIAAAVATVVGVAIIVIRRRTAPLAMRMEPLLDYTDNSDL